MHQASVDCPVLPDPEFLCLGDSVRFHILQRFEEHILLRLAINEPVLRWLLVVISVLSPVFIDNRRLDREVYGQVVWLCVRIFHNHSPPPPG